MDKKRIRFIRDTIPEREGGPGYKLGDEVELLPNQCERWRIRNAAEYVQLIEQAEQAEQEGETDGDTMDGSADVGEQDGGDSGQRSESDAGTSEPRPRGRPPKHRG